MKTLSAIVIGLAALASSCSNSDSTSEPTNTAPSTACGAAPYVTAVGTVSEFQVGPYRKKEGLKVTFDLCPGKTYTTDVDGKATIQITKGKPFLTFFDHPDDIPMMFPEWVLDADFTGETFVVPASYQSIVAPGLTPDVALLAIGVTLSTPATDGGTDPCESVAGVVVEIPGHPEAKIEYYSSETIPKPDPTLSSTSTFGGVLVSGLADGTTVEPVASKAGCTLTAKRDGFTGRATVKKGRYVQYRTYLGK